MTDCTEPQILAHSHGAAREGQEGIPKAGPA